jgi:hypothetical protein
VSARTDETLTGAEFRALMEMKESKRKLGPFGVGKSSEKGNTSDPKAWWRTPPRGILRRKFPTLLHELDQRISWLA